LTTTEGNVITSCCITHVLLGMKKGLVNYMPANCEVQA